MTEQQHPITLPSELLEQWRKEAKAFALRFDASTIRRAFKSISEKDN